MLTALVLVFLVWFGFCTLFFGNRMTDVTDWRDAEQQTTLMLGGAAVLAMIAMLGIGFAFPSLLSALTGTSPHVTFGSLFLAIGILFVSIATSWVALLLSVRTHIRFYYPNVRFTSKMTARVSKLGARRGI